MARRLAQADELPHDPIPNAPRLRIARAGSGELDGDWRTGGRCRQLDQPCHSRLANACRLPC
jgi:hypothetical protein